MVPIGLLLAVAVAASVGGGSFGGLGQLVAGPEVPAAGAGAPTSTQGRPSDAGLPRLPPSTAAGRAARDTAAGSRARRPGTTAPRDGDRSSGDAGRGGQGPGGPPSAVEVGAPAASPSRPAPGFRPTPSPATPQPPAGTTPSPNLVRDLGAAGQRAIRPLPVVGPPVADAVGTVVDLVAPPLL